MPRKSRIDAPGALHHITVRGISKIFQDNSDRDHFLSRLADIIKETKTRCYAWALIPDHLHLLLKTGKVPMATIMKKLLTGYAISYNRKYRRHGHLFQNRYKSILCQDTYFKELVRYIHLNPLLAHVTDIQKLDSYPYTGHSSILDKVTNSWQDVDGVLGLFADKISLARRRYRSFVKKGVNQGKRQDLTVGGLMRSQGGWTATLFQKSNERILGDSDFVKRVLLKSREHMDRKYLLPYQGVTIESVLKIAANLMNIEPKLVFTLGKERDKVRARSLLCYWSARKLGISMTNLSKQLNMSLSSISLSVKRGEQIVMENRYSLTDLLKQEM